MQDAREHDGDRRDEGGHGDHGRDVLREGLLGRAEPVPLAALARAFERAKMLRRHGGRRAMRRLVAAIGLSAGMLATALAGSLRDTVAEKYGEAMAIAAMCPSLAIDDTMMALYATSLGVVFDDTFKAVLTIHHNRALTDLHDRREAAICATGRYLFGEDGVSAPGILVDR